MDFTFGTIKITTSSTVSHWGVCFAENGFFLTLEVKGDSEKSALIVGREILEVLLTKFADQEKRTLQSVEELLDQVKNNQALISLNIVILSKDILYLGSRGEGEVLLNRKGDVRQILSLNETASGRVKNGDKLLLSSKTFIEKIGREKRQHIITLTDQDEIMGYLSPFLKEEGTAGAASLLVSLETESKKKQLPADLLLWRRFKYSFGNFKDLKFPFLKKTADLQVEETPSKKNLLLMATGLIFLLIISIFFNISGKRQSEKKERLSQALELVSHQYEEAVSLIDLNPLRSRSLLSNSKLSLSPFLKEFSQKSDEYKQINEWINKISEQEVAAYKIYKFTSLPVFFDINLIKEEGIGTKMRGFGETKVVLDTKNKLVYSLSTKTKQAAIVAGSEDVKQATAISVHGENAYILNSDGVVRIDLTEKKAQLIIKKDETWGEIVSISAFAGNVYLLDRTSNAVWKYIGAESGFSNRANYLNPDVKMNFSAAQEMLIDGSVWMSKTDDVLKFTRGLPDEFSFKGFSDSLANITAISTSDTDENFYILDKDTSRIIVFDKEGTYISQYQWDELKNADDFVASEEEKKIYVLMGGKIYGIEIK